MNSGLYRGGKEIFVFFIYFYYFFDIVYNLLNLRSFHIMTKYTGIIISSLYTSVMV